MPSRYELRAFKLNQKIIKKNKSRFKDLTRDLINYIFNI